MVYSRLRRFVDRGKMTYNSYMYNISARSTEIHTKSVMVIVLHIHEVSQEIQTVNSQTNHMSNDHINTMNICVNTSLPYTTGREGGWDLELESHWAHLLLGKFITPNMSYA